MAIEELKNTGKTFNIEVGNCNHCPFANHSTGGHKNPFRLRRQLGCNLLHFTTEPNTKLGGGQFTSSNKNYDFFERCPLKVTQVNITIKPNSDWNTETTIN